MSTVHPPQRTAQIKLSLREKLNLLLPYLRKKLMEQVQAVALIVTYLIAFQTLVLGIAIAEAAVIAVGIGVIVVGLAIFMEGLFLGLMPLGETIGIRLPQKTKLPVLLGFSFILGVGVTFAEPAIGVLQLAGAFIKAWDAPLLFLLLNKYADLLKWAVGIGVGLAVILGMLRFMFSWSLKPFLYIGIPLVTVFSLWCSLDPNLGLVLGLAWDTGGVTTGPVTVPLVLALGIGITRVMAKGDGGGGGFGVVTLASLLPIYTVLLLAVAVGGQVPKPMTPAEFFSPAHQPLVENLFLNRDAMVGYALRNAPEEAQLALVGGSPKDMEAYVARLRSDPELRLRVLGSSDRTALEAWAVNSGSDAQRRMVFETETDLRRAVLDLTDASSTAINVGDVAARNGGAALQAILPLSLFLVFVLLVIVREKLPRADEILLGLLLGVVGMFLFNVGIELGLSKLGNQVGSKLPSSFKRIELVESTRVLRDFDESVLLTAIADDGTKTQFFYANLNNAYVAVPFQAAALDPSSGNYRYVPTKGPLWGSEDNPLGYLLVIVFAFVMGYGATLAEPALNALGATVEVLTVGTFKKSLLMQTVAIGVGVGIAVGVMKIIWGIPLLWLIAPPYLLLMVLTFLSTEEFVNIGWDSAGVTTGPITVPLVLAMGLGISAQVGAVEGFGILASASVFPILAVLTVGLAVHRRKAGRQLSVQ